MKFEQAKDIILRKCGYRVEFERHEESVLISDHFPERDEEPIPSLDEAWDWAEKFAAATKKLGYVNVYVVYAHNWTPVPGYECHKLNRYP